MMGYCKDCKPSDTVKGPFQHSSPLLTAQGKCKGTSTCFFLRLPSCGAFYLPPTVFFFGTRNGVLSLGPTAYIVRMLL